jgi:ribonuclease BN (tRNA processing enzyme)
MAPAEVLDSTYRPSGRCGGDFDVRPHATMAEIAETAAAARVKHLVLTHFRAGPVDEESVLAVLRAHGYGEKVTFAVDGLEIPV